MSVPSTDARKACFLVLSFLSKQIDPKLGFCIRFIHTSPDFAEGGQYSPSNQPRSRRGARHEVSLDGWLTISVADSHHTSSTSHKKAARKSRAIYRCWHRVADILPFASQTTANPKTVHCEQHILQHNRFLDDTPISLRMYQSSKVTAVEEKGDTCHDIHLLQSTLCLIEWNDGIHSKYGHPPSF